MNDPDYVNKLARWRADRDSFFAGHYASPLTEEDQAGFTGLRYFPPDERMVFTVALVENDSPVAVEASTGSVSTYRSAGTVDVPFAGGAVRLIVLHGEEDELFIPFRDATSGSTTYGGGRYVPVTPAGEGRHVVDFNRATNPYCAYDPEFSCPLPPQGNTVSFPIEAGELDFP